MGWGVLPGEKPRGGRRQLPDAGNVVAGVLHGLTQGVIGYVGGAGDGGGLGVQIHGGLYAGQVIVKPDAVQKLELCYIPIYHEESKSFTLVPAWHAELYTYPYQEDPDHIRVEQVFLDAYDGHQLYPPEEVPTDAAS